MEGSEHVGRGEGDSGGEATSRVWRRAGGMRQLDLEAAKGSGRPERLRLLYNIVSS